MDAALWAYLILEWLGFLAILLFFALIIRYLFLSLTGWLYVRNLSLKGLHIVAQRRYPGETQLLRALGNISVLETREFHSSNTVSVIITTNYTSVISGYSTVGFSFRFKNKSDNIVKYGVTCQLMRTNEEDVPEPTVICTKQVHPNKEGTTSMDTQLTRDQFRHAAFMVRSINLTLIGPPPHQGSMQSIGTFELPVDVRYYAVGLFIGAGEWCSAFALWLLRDVVALVLGVVVVMFALAMFLKFCPPAAEHMKRLRYLPDADALFAAAAGFTICGIVNLRTRGRLLSLPFVGIAAAATGLALTAYISIDPHFSNGIIMLRQSGNADPEEKFVLMGAGIILLGIMLRGGKERLPRWARQA